MARVGDAVAMPTADDAEAELKSQRHLVEMAAELVRRAYACVPADQSFQADHGVGAETSLVAPHLDDGVNPLDLPIREYTRRLFDHFCLSREVYVVSSVYIVRLLAGSPGVFVSTISVHKLLLVSVVLAAKWREDCCDVYPDAHYAGIGGVTMEEYRQVEAKFVKRVGWKLHVSPCEFERHRRMASTESTKWHKYGMSISSVASSSTTSPGSTPTASDDEDDEDEREAPNDFESDGEVLPGRPLWGSRSYVPTAAAMTLRPAGGGDSLEEDPDGEVLPGKTCWGTWSYVPVVTGIETPRK
mmetsp:Transcript_8282/g.20895  ORF Transcript_8282/g.20895 Transcript_8282/m.20895 type:complete len:300 (+) Transcript_8282:108-1007(+)